MVVILTTYIHWEPILQVGVKTGNRNPVNPWRMGSHFSAPTKRPYKYHGVFLGLEEPGFFWGQTTPFYNWLLGGWAPKWMEKVVIGSLPFVRHYLGHEWKGSHNPILRGPKRSPW